MHEPLGAPDVLPAGAAPFVARAAALRPRLRELQEEHAARGGYGTEIHQALVDAGLYRLLTPARFGGAEQDLATFLAVAAELSRGDPAVGWSFTLGAARSYHVASYFSEAGQEDLFSVGDLIAPGRVMPTGHAGEVAGGHRLDGTWSYCSGSTWSTHVVVAATVSDRSGREAPMRFFAVPRAEYGVLDDWGGERTLGMAASGSNSVAVHDVFVPLDRSIPYELMMMGPATVADSPGYQLHGNPTYLGMPGMFFLAELVASQVGAARAALDEYEVMMRTRSTSVPPVVPWIESDEAHRRYGTMLTRADAAESLLTSTATQAHELMRQWAAGGPAFTPARDLRLRAVVQEAGRMAGDVVDTALTTAGTRATRAGSRLAKYHRDATMYRTHVLADSDLVATHSSRATLDAMKRS